MKRNMMMVAIVILAVLLVGLICVAVIPRDSSAAKGAENTGPVETQQTEAADILPSEETQESVENTVDDEDIVLGDLSDEETQPQKETEPKKETPPKKEEPTQPPTEEPTQSPSETPSEEPTQMPTEAPTEEPTEAPTEEPKDNVLPGDMLPFG